MKPKQQSMTEVTCAIILNGDLILAARRSEAMPLPLKWEFPGGKIEKDETAESCLLRELKEELNILTFTCCPSADGSAVE